MSDPQPEPQVSVHENRVCISIDRNLYPLDAVYGAAYTFIDRCFVLLDAPTPERVRVELRGREELGAEALQSLAGNFANELLTQVWRQRVGEQNRELLSATTARAMGGALGPAGLADLNFDMEGTAFDDPLGIAVPWEEKYGNVEADAGAGSPASVGKQE